MASGAANRPATGLPPPVVRPYLTLTVCALLLLAVAVVFLQTASYDFINFDDPEYISRNRHVTGGHGADAISWAFYSYYASNWHPLTWLSHMLDCQLFGLRAGGHHLTSALLHAISAIVLFLALKRMTAEFWPSAWVAAVFAIHPLRVESVAWVAERKDVLSGFFFMLTLWFYARYAERPGSWARYSLVVASFALGLMAKPMLVTLPFVLLLLDYWPLCRIDLCRSGNHFDTKQMHQRQRLWPLVAEKIPLFVLAAGSCAVTLVAQRDAVSPLDQLPLSGRMANAVVAYIAYLGKMLYPSCLAILYPLSRDRLPASEVISAAAVLLIVSAAVFITRKRHPYLLFGWLWFLGTLAPVIGLVQVGTQAMADRYSYLTQIGLYVAIAWGAAEIARVWPHYRWLVVTILLTCVVGSILAAWRQAQYWRNSETLWAHAVACTSPNPIAENNLGAIVADRAEAIAHYEKGVWKSIPTMRRPITI